MDQRTCKTCDTAFQPTHSRNVYCNDACRQDTHPKQPIACTHCGTVAMKYPSKRYTPFCGMGCRDQYMRVHKLGPHYIRPKKVVEPREPYDGRSDLRRAVEDGDAAAVLSAIKARVEITVTGCWEWQGRLKAGYAEVTIGPRYVAVHRLSLEAKLGMPLGDQPAHHACANAACVNPDHLQPVTHAENTAEMLARSYMVRRIATLEAALRVLTPDHPALAEVSVSLEYAPDSGAPTLYQANPVCINRCVNTDKS